MTVPLILPGSMRPHNLTLPESAFAAYVENDMYGICERVKEISPTIRIIGLEHDKTETHAFAIMEICDDGWERLIFKVDELDGRVIDRLRFIFSVPFAERVALCEKENHRFEEEEHENQLEDLYERVGAPMLVDLERCGFIQRNKSYAKAGHVGGRGSNRAMRRAAERSARRAK